MIPLRRAGSSPFFSACCTRCSPPLDWTIEATFWTLSCCFPIQKKSMKKKSKKLLDHHLFCNRNDWLLSLWISMSYSYNSYQSHVCKKVSAHNSEKKRKGCGWRQEPSAVITLTWPRLQLRTKTMQLVSW